MSIIKTPVIVDANFLITALKFKIHITRAFDESLLLLYELVTIKEVIMELNGLVSKRVKNAGMALKFLEKNVKLINTSTTSKNLLVDDLILETAKERQAIVATNDKELRMKLKKVKINTLIIKSKNRFFLERDCI